MPSTTLRWMFVVALFLQVGALRAEGGCPPGYYPIGAPQGQQGPQGCAPIPGGDSGSLSEPPPPPPRPVPPLEWKPDWGAVAVDEEHGTLGSAIEAPTEDEAKDGALKDCRSKGGVACHLVTSYENGCVALAASHTGWAVEAAATEIEAEVNAISACARIGHKKCSVQFKNCSRPNGFSRP